MSNPNDIEFGGIQSTLDLCDCIMDSIHNDYDFLEQSCIDILEG
jgi:hypothetical protein